MWIDVDNQHGKKKKKKQIHRITVWTEKDMTMPFSVLTVMNSEGHDHVNLLQSLLQYYWKGWLAYWR